MGLARIIARRSLTARPGRTIFSLLGIALGITTVVGVFVLDHNTIVGLSALQRGVGADVELRGLGDGGEELSDVEGISLATRFFQADGLVRIDRSRRPNQARVRVVALETATASELGIYRLAEGVDLTPGAGEVLVGTELAERLDLEPGESLTMSRPRRVGKKRCVNGQLVEADGPVDRPAEVSLRVAGVLTREQLGRNAGGMVAVIEFDLGRVVFEGTRIDEKWWGKRDTAVDVERLRASLARTTSFELDKGAIMGQAADERAFRTGVRMAGLLALVLGLYVIFHTLSMSLTERIGEVGTLVALGTTRRQVARIFLLEATALAGGGAGLGLLGGLGLARLLLIAGITTLGRKSISTFAVPWTMTLALTGLGFAIALVGSIYPLVTLKGANAVSALRGEEALRTGRSQAGFHLLYAALLAFVLPALYFVIVPAFGDMSRELVSAVLGGVAFLGLIVMLSLIMPAVLSGTCAAVAAPFSRVFPLAGRLAARAIRGAPARIGVSTSALALVAAGLVGLKGMTGSLSGEIDRWASEAVAEKVWVRNMPPTQFDALKSHLRQYGMIGVEPNAARVYSPFMIQGTDVDELLGYGPLASDPTAARAVREGQGIVLSKRLAADLDYSVGEPVKLERADGRVESLEVVAITDAYGHFPYPDERMYGLVSRKVMEDYYCADMGTVTEVAIKVPEGDGVSIVRAAIEAFHGGPHQISFRTGEEIRKFHHMDLSRDFILFDVLIALSAALAGLGALNGQLLAALERSKELGVLRALGSTRGQLAGMVLLEAAAIGVVGGILGAGIGLASTPLVVGALEELAGLELVAAGSGIWTWATPLGTLGIALLSALYPVWRVSRVDAVRAVRTG